MKKFYVTSNPDTARHILMSTMEEALAKAEKQVASGTHIRRFVVQIVVVVEEAPSPIKITYLEGNPDYEV